MTQPPIIYLIGLSGPASAGKTTLAHLLRRVFTPCISHILHGDDFCREFAQIPTRDGYLDADGPAGVDFVRMGEVLDFVKGNGGRTPGDFESWQADVFAGQVEKALELAGDEVVIEMRKEVEGSGVLGGSGQGVRMVIIEGFMLYNVPEIRERLDVRLFVRLSHGESKRRRMSRPNYGAEAKEGEFWKTEEYFEKMVWRNYVEQHRNFFDEGDVEGQVDAERCR